MSTFYATYSASESSGSTVTALQGTTPWIVAGAGTAGTSGTAVLTVQGIAGGTAIPISGSITATNPSIGATGAAVPASGTYIAASVAGTLTGLVATAAGLKVDASATTQPVSGTVAATQSGTWTVQPGNTANTTAWKVDGSAVTQPVSGTVAVTQSTSPWVTSGTATVSGTVAATQSGTWNIGTVTAVTALTNALPAGSNIIGNVRLDQTTPGTTNGVVVNTQAPQTTTTAVFQAEGAVAFGSITNSYVTLFTPTAATKILQMRNNTNAAISVSMDAGSTTNYTLDQGDSISLDLLANALNMGATAIQVKYAVGAPTSGSFRINGVH